MRSKQLFVAFLALFFTLSAFGQGVKEGTQKDDKVIVLHDDSIDRTTNGIGNVIDLSYKEISKLEPIFISKTSDKSNPLKVSVLDSENISISVSENVSV